MKWGPWYLRSRTLTVWEAVCPRCGAIADYGYTKWEAVEVAKEQLWADGLCADCWERERGCLPLGRPTSMLSKANDCA
jgi:hypothetical protein